MEYCKTARVNADVLSLGLHGAGLITSVEREAFSRVEVPAADKLDGELPGSLAGNADAQGPLSLEDGLDET
jgi:hypothetical protein